MPDEDVATQAKQAVEQGVDWVKDRFKDRFRDGMTAPDLQRSAGKEFDEGKSDFAQAERLRSQAKGESVLGVLDPALAKDAANKDRQASDLERDGATAVKDGVKDLAAVPKAVGDGRAYDVSAQDVKNYQKATPTYEKFAVISAYYEDVAAHAPPDSPQAKAAKMQAESADRAGAKWRTQHMAPFEDKLPPLDGKKYQYDLQLEPGLDRVDATEIADAGRKSGTAHKDADGVHIVTAGPMGGNGLADVTKGSVDEARKDPDVQRLMAEQNKELTLSKLRDNQTGGPAPVDLGGR